MNEQRARPASEATNHRAGPAPEATSRAHDVVAHLQAAALEMIEAARAFLDVAEELVKEPGEATAMAATLAHLAGRVVPSGPGGPEGSGDHQPSPAGSKGRGQSPAGSKGHQQSPAGSKGHGQSPGVEHIRVS